MNVQQELFLFKWQHDTQLPFKIVPAISYCLHFRPPYGTFIVFPQLLDTKIFMEKKIRANGTCIHITFAFEITNGFHEYKFMQSMHALN